MASQSLREDINFPKGNRQSFRARKEERGPSVTGRPMLTSKKMCEGKKNFSLPFLSRERKGKG